MSNYAKTRCAPPAIKSFAGEKRGDSGKLLACLIYAQEPIMLGKV